MDLPKESENMYIAQHFDKLDKDFANITRASKTTDILTQSINLMETMRQIEANQKAQRKATKSGKTTEYGKPGAPYLLLNKNALPTEYAVKEFVQKKDAHNERAQRQDEIERRLVGQLGDRYKDAQLLEVSEGSYLIRNRIKLPIFGRKMEKILLTKDYNIDKHKAAHYAHLHDGKKASELKRFKLDSNLMLSNPDMK